MNKTLIIVALAMILVMPLAMATDVGTGVGITVNTQKFAPRVWMCDGRTTADDNTQNSANGVSLAERKHNYAFEGESIHWTVLVMDKNKIEDVQDVVGTIGQSQGAGNDVEVECKRLIGVPSFPKESFGSGQDPSKEVPQSCNAKIDQFVVKDFDSNVMAFYDCALTVETPASMHGEYFITVEAKDGSGLSGTMAENEYWFLNPTIALSVDGNLAFDDVMPGTDSYSNTILVGNDAEAGSGVMLDMFISGTDFYDPSSSGALCSKDNNGKYSNRLNLDTFGYFVTNGAFSSSANGIPSDMRDICDQHDGSVDETDSEGYTDIPYSTDISGSKRIMRWNTDKRGESPSSSVVALDWNCGNALSPGSEMALTFKLSMPEPCNGDFSEGQIYFWGEAI